MRIDKLKLSVELVKLDMTQTQLADLAGVSRGTVSNIKGGKSCSDVSAIKIANALNLPITELLEK